MIVTVNFQTFQSLYMYGKVFVKETEDSWEMWTYEGLFHIKCTVEKSEDMAQNIMFIDRYFADRQNIVKAIDIVDREVQEEETDDEVPMTSDEAEPDTEQIDEPAEDPEMKHKYIKKEGSSGNYRYTYPGDEKEETSTQQESDKKAGNENG